MWKPSITPSDVIRHSQGPWEKHKYIIVQDGKYYYPNSYEDGRTISDLKGDKSSLKDEDIDKIADETIKGKHGNGQERKEKFGGDYNRIQNKVNEKLGNSKRYKEDEEDEDKDKDSKEEEKKDSESKEEKDKDSKDDEKSSKKKGSGSSKKSDKEKSSKKSSKSKKSEAQKKAEKEKKEAAKREKELKARRAKNQALIKKRTEEQKKETELRKRRNNINRKSYLNHSFWAPTEEVFLCHHGIKHQKWGVRNGPPYPLDEKQKSPSERRYRTDKGYKNTSGSTQYTGKKKKATQMSNEELKRQINRKQLEQKYNELNDAQIERGKNKVMQLVRDYATVAGAIGSTVGTAYTIYKMTHKIMK